MAAPNAEVCECRKEGDTVTENRFYFLPRDFLQFTIVLNLSEGRFVLGTFRSERMRVLNRSRQTDRLRVMLVLVHIDITPPHTPLPVFWRIGERTMPYSRRACKQLRHLVGCVIHV
ncbi:UNVERIFIED_CONTAM: hypothetical protein NCL1_15097 [Trichonephila clavipes]